MISVLHWWRRRELQRRQPSPQKAYPGFKQLQSVLIIYRLGSLSPEILKQWEAEMPAQARLTCLAFFAGRRKELKPQQNPVITKDDKNWLALPAGPVWQEMSIKNYDLCIDLDSGTEAFLPGFHQLIANRMLVKVGGSSLEEAQLWINEDPRQEQARRTVVKYLKLINS